MPGRFRNEFLQDDKELHGFRGLFRIKYMNKDYILAKNNIIPLVNIRELHLFNGAGPTTGDDFTDDGYFHLWGIVYGKASSQFSQKVKSECVDVHALKEYTKINFPEAECVKFGTIYVKPNNKLDYDQYWEYLWNGAFKKAEDISKAIEMSRNEFFDKIIKL